MYRHPGIQEVCVISSRDSYRGETVKALVVRKPSHAELTEPTIIDWCRAHISAYKAPRIVQFGDALPKNASGKVMWKKQNGAVAMVDLNYFAESTMEDGCHVLASGSWSVQSAFSSGARAMIGKTKRTVPGSSSDDRVGLSYLGQAIDEGTIIERQEPPSVRCGDGYSDHQSRCC
jgi:hypothetical protein